MNILETLKKDLSNLEDNYEKLRYIYLKLCEIFTFDLRFSYGSYEFQKQLCNQKYDLENITNLNVICVSFVKEIFNKVVEELLNLKVCETGIGHKYSHIIVNDKIIVADAILGSDTSRVKLNCSTVGYQDLDLDFRDNNRQLLAIDTKINYIRDIYFDDQIKKIVLNLPLFYFDSRENEDLSLLEYKLKIIKTIIANNIKIKTFADYKFSFEYCLRKFLTPKERNAVEEIFLGENYDDDLQMINLYWFHALNTYYLLQNDKIKEINSNDADNYLKSYRKLEKRIFI